MGKEKGKGREGEGRRKRSPCSDFTVWSLHITREKHWFSVNTED